MYINKVIAHRSYSSAWLCKIDAMDMTKKYAICKLGSNPTSKINIMGFPSVAPVYLKKYVTEFVVSDNKLIILNSHEETCSMYITDKYNVCEAINYNDGMGGGYGIHDFIVEYSETPDELPSYISDICIKVEYYQNLICNYEENKDQYSTQILIPNIALFKSEFRKYLDKYNYEIIKFQS